MFSAAINAGVRAAVGEDIALLNSDIVVTPNWLSNLRTALHSAPDIGVVGPRSNNVHAPQGPIWVEDLSPAGIDRFGRFFNHSDPARWFENRRLSGFAMLLRRNAWEAAGGFDEQIPWFGLEDKALCDALAGAGWRLVCAGDTFIFHMGHRTARLTRLNRTATRFGRTEVRGGSVISEEARLVRDDQGEVFEVYEGVASHIETGVALGLVRAGRPIEPAAPELLAGLPVGSPIRLVRLAHAQETWVLHSGFRRRVSGDPHRLRRAMGVSIAAASELDSYPVGPDVAIEDAFGPVSELKPILPNNPAAISAERLAPLAHVAGEIASALAEQRGYALIRLDVPTTVVLNEGLWTIPEEDLETADAYADDDPPAAAAAVRNAIIDADAVGVTETRDTFAGAALLEQLLFHLDLYPRLRCSAAINHELLGIDPGTGRIGRQAPLVSALAGRPVALAGPTGLVGWAAWQRREHLRRRGLDARLVVGLDGLDEVERALLELGEQRELYDAVLVCGGPAAKSLCARLARELEVVALDIGDALDRELLPRYRPGSAAARAARDISRYLRQLSSAPGEPHELDGRLVRVPGQPGVWYVERGRARLLVHRALVALFEQAPVEIEAETLASLPEGVPLGVVHERLVGTYLLVDGQKRPVDFALPFAVANDDTAEALGFDSPVVHWYPGASNGQGDR